MNFEPIHDAHAIEQVVISIQFNAPLRNENFAELRKIAEAFKPELPGRSPLQTITLALGGGGVVPAPVAQGFSMHISGADGVIQHELRVDANSLTYRTTSYSRWALIWERARKYFEALLGVYVRDVKLAAISINYVDKFVWSGSEMSDKTSSLIREGSKYLPKHIYESSDLWHSHTGAFVKVDKNTKRLINVNVDHIDETQDTEMRRAIVISTVLTDIFDQVGYEPLSIDGEEAHLDFLNEKITALHDLDKDVLGDIINDEMCQRIDLKL